MKSMARVTAGSLTTHKAYGRFTNSLHHLLGAGHIRRTAAAVVPIGWSGAQGAQHERDAGQWKCSFSHKPHHCSMPWPLQHISSEQHLAAWVKECSLLHFNSDCGTLRSTSSGNLPPPRAPSEYELSRGKIVDILKCDYPAMFERTPNFEIYDESIIFELGQPFHAVRAVRGKRAYCRALSTLRRLSCSTVRDGRVWCKVADGQPYGHDLRVPWTCEGMLRLPTPVRIYISAVSLYSIRPQIPPPLNSQKRDDFAAAPAALRSLSHRIHRHCIEFVEIHPPSLRSVLLHFWWERQGCNVDPVFALGGGGAAASTIAKGF